MDRKDKQKTKKPEKELNKRVEKSHDEKKTPEGIPDVDFKKFLGCG